MSDNAASFVGNIPEHYDRGLGPVFFTDFAEEMAKRVAAFAPRRMLETSAGTGIVSRRLRDLSPADTTLTVTDLNPPMLEVARKVQAGRGGRVPTGRCDRLAIYRPKLRRPRLSVRHHVFPGQGEVLSRGISRPLAGRTLFLQRVGCAPFQPGAAPGARGAGRTLPDDPPPFYEVPFAYHRIDPVREAVSEAGFTDFRAAVLHIDKTAADPAAFARGIIFGNPVVEQIRARGGDPERVTEQIAEMLHGEFGTPPRLPMQVIFFEARRP